MNLKRFALAQPLGTAILAAILGIFLTELPLASLLKPYLGPIYGDYLAGLALQFLATGAFLAILKGLGLGSYAGGLPTLRPPRKARTWLLAWPLLFFALLNGSEALDGTLRVNVLTPLFPVLLTLYLSTGFIEEVLFRGLVFGLLAKAWEGKGRRGLMGAVFASSLLFSLTHVANFAMGRSSALTAASQVVYTFFFGVLFCALFVRTSSLLPGIVLHMVVDFFGDLQALVPGNLPRHGIYRAVTPESALVSILITLPLLAAGLVYLRKSKTGGRNVLER